MDWRAAEDTLQKVGLLLLAADNAEGLRRGLAQPDIKPSPLTERVFALLKEVRADARVPPGRPVSSIRRVVAQGKSVGHGLTTSGKLACGRRIPLISTVPHSEFGPGDCKDCLRAVEKLRILRRDRLLGGFLVTRESVSGKDLDAIRAEWERMRDRLSTMHYAEVVIGGVKFEWHRIA